MASNSRRTTGLGAVIFLDNEFASLLFLCVIARVPRFQSVTFILLRHFICLKYFFLHSYLLHEFYTIFTQHLSSPFVLYTLISSICHDTTFAGPDHDWRPCVGALGLILCVGLLGVHGNSAPDLHLLCGHQSEQLLFGSPGRWWVSAAFLSLPSFEFIEHDKKNVNLCCPLSNATILCYFRSTLLFADDVRVGQHPPVLCL